MKENFDVESKTEGEAFERLQEYIAEKHETSPCAVMCKVNALEGADKRKTDKMGVLVWYVIGWSFGTVCSWWLILDASPVAQDPRHLRAPSPLCHFSVPGRLVQQGCSPRLELQ